MSHFNRAQVYHALASHQLEENWPYQDVIRRLHEWADRFNSHFKLELTPVALRIGGASSNCYGHFRAGPNDFGLSREIAFEELFLRAQLAAGEWWQTLGTLLHEQLHAWQHDHGQPGKRNYHNAQFREKAAAVGFAVTSRGTQEYIPDSPFFRLLAEHGVVVPQLSWPKSVVARPGSTLKKWSCGCTNARVAVADFQALCLKCGERFVRVN
jgi:hypothetical protein